MNTLSLGAVVAIRCWWGEHWGIVAVKNGRWSLISNSARRGMVSEEDLEEVLGNAELRVIQLASPHSAFLAIERARSRIGSQYDFWKWNCEDFVHWAAGLPPRSPQRNAVLALLSLIGVIAVARAAAAS